MNRDVEFFFDPPSAMPTSLGVPVPSLGGVHHSVISVNLFSVSTYGMQEIIATGGYSAASPLFYELLASSSSDLRWKGTGFGIGAEIRRGLSALFGRFFARAYLQKYHGYVTFVPLEKGKASYKVNGLRYKVDMAIVPTLKRPLMPDWLCWKPTAMAFGEAKGRWDTKVITGAHEPDAVTKGKAQVSAAHLFEENPSTGTYSSKAVERWVVMNRWVSENNPAVAPVLYVKDPPVEGEPFDERQLEKFGLVLIRRNIERIARELSIDGVERKLRTMRRGLGRDIVGKHQPRVAVSFQHEILGSVASVGAVISPQGNFNSDPDYINFMLNAPSHIRQKHYFVGLDVDVVRQALDPGAVRFVSSVAGEKMRSTDGISDNAHCTLDGFILSSLDLVRPLPQDKYPLL